MPPKNAPTLQVVNFDPDAFLTNVEHAFDHVVDRTAHHLERAVDRIAHHVNRWVFGCLTCCVVVGLVITIVVTLALAQDKDYASWTVALCIVMMKSSLVLAFYAFCRN